MKQEQENNITSRELDVMARRGFEALYKLVESGEVSKADQSRATAALKLIDHGNRRYAAETNRASVQFKIIKEVGSDNDIGFDRMRPMLELLTGPTPNREQPGDDTNAGATRRTKTKEITEKTETHNQAPTNENQAARNNDAK